MYTIKEKIGTRLRYGTVRYCYDYSGHDGLDWPWWFSPLKINWADTEVLQPLCEIMAWRYRYLMPCCNSLIYQKFTSEGIWLCSNSLVTLWQFVWRLVYFQCIELYVIIFVHSGGFMLTVVPQKDEEVAHVIDFREVAPLAATRDMFHGNELLARWVRIHNFTLSEYVM